MRRFLVIGVIGASLVYLIASGFVWAFGDGPGTDASSVMFGLVAGIHMGRWATE